MDGHERVLAVCAAVAVVAAGVGFAAGSWLLTVVGLLVAGLAASVLDDWRRWRR